MHLFPALFEIFHFNFDTFTATFYTFNEINNIMLVMTNNIRLLA